MTSLVIPTYNREKLIGETLRSAINQTTPFKEIIVVDDGSTDHTNVVLDQFLNKIKVIRTKNQGVQTARNIGVDAATSERIAFCDSDDLLDQDYLNVVQSWLATRPHIDATYSNFSTFGARPWYSDRFFSAPEGYFESSVFDSGFYVDIPDLYLKSIQYPTMWVTGMTIKKAVYQQLGGFNPVFNKIITEDWEFNLRVISNGNIALCRRPLVRIRFHSENQSGNPVLMALGAAMVLEYVLKNHKFNPSYEMEMKGIISRYLNKAFDLAFSLGDFTNAQRALHLPGFSNNEFKFKVKRNILHMPHLLRVPMWAMSQMTSKIFPQRKA